MADNPYAEFQQDSNEQTEKPAVKKPVTPAGADPYAEFQEQPAADTDTPKEEKPGVMSQLYDKAAGLAGKADNAITGALADKPSEDSALDPGHMGAVAKTGARSLYEGAKTVAGMIPGAYHAFADEATPEEKEQYSQFEQEHGEEPGEETSGMKRIGLGVQRMTGAQAAKDAAQVYMNPKTRPTYEQMLSVAPEALGQGAGTVVGGKLGEMGGEKLGKTVKENAPAIKEKMTAPVRAGAKVVNAAKNNPEVTGAVTGGLMGAGHGPVGVGIGAVEGARGGGMVNRFLKKVPNLNESFGKRPTPEAQNLVGNEYTPPATEPVPPAKEGKPRIEYAEPTEHPKAEGLVGNEHTEQQTPATGEMKPRNPVQGVEYGEHQPAATTPDKEITKEMVKSSPGTSMSPEGKTKIATPETVGTKEGAAADNAHVAKAKEELGANAPVSKILERAQTLKDEAAAEHAKTLGNKPVGNVAPEAKEVTRAANDYNEQTGKPPIKNEKVAADPRAGDVADAYDAMKHDPNDPAVQKSYAALIKDTMDQFHHLLAEGYKFDTSPEDPYQGEDASKQMLDDIHNNKHLSVWEGGAPPADHPLSAIDPETGKSYNSIFRFVHDIMGHGAGDNDFSQAGEENAYQRHAQSYSPEAIPALTTETKGQTSHYFNNEKVRNGGAHEFAEQKAALLPEEFYAKSEPAQVKGAAPEQANAAETHPEDVLSHIESGKDHAVLTAENPNNGRISDEENATRNEALKKELIEKGYKPVEVTGHTKDVEGETEHSFFVPDIKPADAAELGRKYGQQAVLTSEGLHDLNKDVVNPVKKGEGVMTDEAARKQPYYSRVGDVDFSVPIDFDQEVKPGGTEKAPEAKGESKVSPEDVTNVNNIVKDLGEQDIIKAGKTYDVDHEKYDFKKRDEGRHRVEREQYAKDLTETIPDEMKQKLVKAAEAFDDADDSTFTDAERSNDSRAQRAKAIWDRAHEVNTEAQAAEKMAAKGPAPEATTETANMSDEELLKHGFTKEDIEAGKQFPEAGGGGKGKSAAAEKGIPEAFAKHMTPEEIASVTKTDRGTQSFLESMAKLPSVQEYTDIALAGEGARKWYQRSASAFDAVKEEAPKYFDQEGDKDKFIGLLASSSPRQSVAMNMRETLGAWKAYVDAGRPEGEALKSLLRENFTLPNTKIPNAMKALADEKMWPDLSKNTAFKAPSFERNLRGWLDYSTNDGWMALFGGVDPAAISKASSYHPLSVATRAAAKALGWETAEAQAAIWSFTQALTERGEELPEEIRRQSEDFADILAHDPQTRQLVSDLGVNLDQLDTRLKAIGEKPEVTGRTTGSTSRSIGQLKGRIEEARGKGAIPPSKSAQGEMTFREPHPVKNRIQVPEETADEDTSFEPEKLEKEESEAIPLNKLYDRSAVLISPEGKLMSIPEYDPRSESPQHPELLRKSGYKGDMTKFLKEGGVRAYTTGPEEAGVEIQNDSPDTIQRALRVVDGLDREKTRFEIADPKSFRTTFSASGTYSQIKAALDKRK